MLSLLALRIGALVCTAYLSAGGAAPNDACVDAVPIIGEGLFAFDNASATPAFREISHDVWFCWTSPCDGEVTIDTCGSTTVDT